MEINIANASDPRLRDYVALRDVTLRKSMEASQGLFIAEGAKIIERAAQAGYRPRSFLLARRWLSSLAGVIEAWPDVPRYIVSVECAEAITGFHVHRGALASFERPQPLVFERVLDAKRIIVCEDIVDHTNVGAIIRCAAGLGWDAVVLAPSAADPLYRRAIKTSMGTVFNIDWVRMRDLGDLTRLGDAGFTLAAMAVSDAAVAVQDYDPPEKLAVMVGTEGAGLSPAWLAYADVVLSIPMKRGVDSLNVAAATAIAAYAFAPPGE